MPQALSRTHKQKATRAKHSPKGLGGLHGPKTTMELVGVATRLERRQVAELNRLARGLMMHKTDLIRKGIDLGIEWAADRLKTLGAAGDSR